MTSTTGSESNTARVIDVNQAALYYEEHGSGEPIVLIHGGLGASQMWQPLIGHLSATFRVITPDSRGHGRSSNPKGELSYSLLADDIAAFVEALNLEKPVVGGWSDGGQVALELGVRHPGLAGGLIVGAAYPDYDTPGMRDVLRQELAVREDGTPDISKLEESLGDLAGLIKSWHAGGVEQWRDLVHQTVPMWVDYPGLTPEELKGIETLTLVLIEDRDESFSVELMVALFRMLPNAELAVCPQSNHIGPLIPERAEVFASVIRDFATRCKHNP